MHTPPRISRMVNPPPILIRYPKRSSLQKLTVAISQDKTKEQTLAQHLTDSYYGKSKQEKKNNTFYTSTSVLKLFRDGLKVLLTVF